MDDYQFRRTNSIQTSSNSGVPGSIPRSSSGTSLCSSITMTNLNMSQDILFSPTPSGSKNNQTSLSNFHSNANRTSSIPTTELNLDGVATGSLQSPSSTSTANIESNLQPSALFHNVNEEVTKKRKIQEEDYKKPHRPTLEKHKLIKKSNTKSHIWSYFHIYDPSDSNSSSLQMHACCNICGDNIVYKTKKKNENGYTYSTGGLLGHCKTMHNINGRTMSKERSKALSDSASIIDSFKKIDAPKFVNREQKREYCHQLTCQWIAADNIPLSVVESDHYRAMMKAHDPGFQISSAKNVGSSIRKTASQMRKKLSENMLKEACWYAVTFDHWTSCAGQNYTGMTCHWMNDEFSLESVALGCFLHEGDGTAENVINKMAWQLVDDCGLDTKKISCFVTDTTGNMNLFGEKCEEIGIPHIYCTDHNLQCTAVLAFKDENYTKDLVNNALIAQDIIAAPTNHPNPPVADPPQEQFQNVIERFTLMQRCRNMCKYFNQSPKALDFLLKKQAQMKQHADYGNSVPKKPKQDVVTRWWSTYSMLVRLLYLKDALYAIYADGNLDDKYMLSDQDWKIIVTITKLLYPFYRALRQLEGQKYTCIGLVPLVLFNLKSSLKAFINQQVQGSPEHTISSNMLKDFNMRWANCFDVGNDTFNNDVTRGYRRRQYGIHPIIGLCHLLDPRTKDLSKYSMVDKRKLYDFALEKMMEMAPTMDSSITNIPREDVDGIDNIDRDDNNVQENIVNRNNAAHPFLDLFDDKEEDNDLNNFGIAANARNLSRNEIIREVCKKELERYKNVPKMNTRQHMMQNNGEMPCPLKEWWLLRKQEFPILAQLTKKYLCIPPTSAPSERIFSKANNLINRQRNRLNPQLAGDLLFVGENIGNEIMTS